MLSACETNTVYTYKLKITTWHREKPLQFNFPIKDISQPYDICVLIKNTPEYPYQNFYFTYYLKDSQSTLLATELKNYQLFEAKTGNPLGKGWTKNKNHEVIIIKNYYFTHPGTYILELAQFMRMEMLPGIETVGIKICKSNQITAK
jgi:gliding motility-associated lipoprotein GldH